MAANRSSRETDMDPQEAQVRAETLKLKQSVLALMADQKPRYNGTEACALLLGPNCSALPASLIEDPVLEPVDKVIWLALMVRASDGMTLLPAHQELAKSAHVTARQTVSRSLSILRCRRWLTVCHTSWRKDGQHRGSAYALHATPLPIADTLYLDPRYVAFLEELSAQRQGRVQKAASAVLGQLSQLGDSVLATSRCRCYKL